MSELSSHSSWIGRDLPPIRRDGKEYFLLGHRGGECPVFCVWLIWSMLPERSKDDDDFQRTSGRTFEGLCAA